MARRSWDAAGNEVVAGVASSRHHSFYGWEPPAARRRRQRVAAVAMVPPGLTRTTSITDICTLLHALADLASSCGVDPTAGQRGEAIGSEQSISYPASNVARTEHGAWPDALTRAVDLGGCFSFFL